MGNILRLATAVVCATSSVRAQTWSDCNPMKTHNCPAKAALAQREFEVDFTRGPVSLAGFTTTSGSIDFSPLGAEFKITKAGEAPTIQSNFYIFYGYVEVVMQAAPGAGIVSSWILQSDDLDEVDWEMIGSRSVEAQSNYFGKGNTTTYDRGQTHPVTLSTSTFHTYAMNWTKDDIVWSIDGRPVRTTTYQSAIDGLNYPQTPMNVRLGNWVAGDPRNNQGTIDWAGGLADFSQGPFAMLVKSVKVINYNPALSYVYGDSSGSSDSIKIEGAIAPSPSKHTSSSSSSASAKSTAIVPSSTAITFTKSGDAASSRMLSFSSSFSLISPKSKTSVSSTKASSVASSLIPTIKPSESTLRVDTTASINTHASGIVFSPFDITGTPSATLIRTTTPFSAISALPIDTSSTITAVPTSASNRNGGINRNGSTGFNSAYTSCTTASRAIPGQTNVSFRLQEGKSESAPSSPHILSLSAIGTLTSASVLGISTSVTYASSGMTAQSAAAEDSSGIPDQDDSFIIGSMGQGPMYTDASGQATSSRSAIPAQFTGTASFTHACIGKLLTTSILFLFYGLLL